MRLFKEMTVVQKRILIAVAAVDLLLAILAAWIYFHPAAQEQDVTVLPGRTAQVVELNMIPEPTPVPIPYPGKVPAAIESPDPAGSPDTEIPGRTGDNKNEICFTLKIGKETVSVARGVDEETLLDHPGWLTTSALPGQEGVCVVYGHRNRNHLKSLKNVSYGDTILVTAQDGKEYRYVIESIEILDSETELKIPLISGKHLLLTTCYPFYYTGHAPQKYVVTAMCP